MNIRIACSIILLIFAYPYSMAVMDMKGENAFKILAIIPYFLNIVYLGVTGYNILLKGRPLP